MFDPTHTSDVTDRDVSHGDLGFYFESLPTPTATLTRAPTNTPTITPTTTATPTPTATPHVALDLGTTAGRPGGAACLSLGVNATGILVSATGDDIGFEGATSRSGRARFRS